MSSYNRTILMGNLTRDLEIRTVGTTSLASFGLAVNRKYQTADGEKRDEATFIDCEAWGKTAEIMAQYLRKGRPVLVEGRLKLDQWEDKDGQKRSKLKVVVESFQFIGPSESGGSDRSPTRPSVQRAPIVEEDIPF